ncbi:MAG: glycosyltransferase family 2 protein [bacterium]|nr:glycosyltransferase family 2 protein [bacterium]
MKALSIIIVTYNSSEYIEPCLYSIYNQKASFNYEVIVFDNNSTDGTVLLIQDQFKDVFVIKSDKNIGFAAANNEAIRKSTSGILLLLNPDTKLTENTLDALYEEISKYDNDRTIMVPVQCNYDTGVFLNCGLGIDIFGFPINEGGTEKFFYADGAAILMKKKDFLDLGMFDEALFLIQEDVDLSWKARLLDYKFKLLREIKILHKSGGSIGCGGKAESDFSTNVFRRYHGEKNIIRNILKNYSCYNLLWVLPSIFIINLAEVILFTFIGKPKVVLSYIKAYQWNIINLRSTLRKRKWIQSRRIIGDRDIIDHMYKGSAKFKLLLKVGIPTVGNN